MSILYNRFVQTIFLNVQDNWQQIIPLDDERNLLWYVCFFAVCIATVLSDYRLTVFHLYFKDSVVCDKRAKFRLSLNASV